MHSRDPYQLFTPPRPCRVHTGEGVHHGLLLGQHGKRQLILHGRTGFTQVTWLPDGASLAVGAEFSD